MEKTSEKTTIIAEELNYLYKDLLSVNKSLETI